MPGRELEFLAGIDADHPEVRGKINPPRNSWAIKLLVFTKNAKDTRGTYASTTAGNVDQNESGVRYGGAHGNNLNYRAYAMGFGQAPEFRTGGGNYDAWQLGRAGFRTDAQLTDHDTLTVQGDL